MKISARMRVETCTTLHNSFHCALATPSAGACPARRLNRNAQTALLAIDPDSSVCLGLI
jgi:hypothetical protein